MSIMDRLDGVISRHSELSALMASGDLDPSKYADLSREYAELSPIVEKAQEMKSTQSELSDLEELLSDGDTDAEMKELAELEREELKGRLPDLEEALRILLLPKKRHYRRHPATSVFADNGDIVSGVVNRKPELDCLARAFMARAVTDIRGFSQVYVKCGQAGLFCCQYSYCHPTAS